MVCIRTRESGSCQDSANAYANGYAHGSLHIYGPWTFERSANQEVNQTSKATCKSYTGASDTSCRVYIIRE